MGNDAVYQIIASRFWATQYLFTNIQTIGAVVIASGPRPQDRKAYIGIAPGSERKEDEQIIAAYGAKLSANEAVALFPQLNVKDYKES